MAQGEGAVCICSSQQRSEARAWAGPLLPWPCAPLGLPLSLAVGPSHNAQGCLMGVSVRSLGGYPGASSSSSSSWNLCWRGWKPRGCGGGWQPRSPGVTEMGRRMEQAWEHEDLHLDLGQWMVLSSFLPDPRISDQIFSSSTLLSRDSCLAFPGYDELGSALKEVTNSRVGASPM